LIYLALVVALVLAALVKKASRPLALVLFVNMVVTVLLQEIVSYQPMMYVDAIAFNAMVILMFKRPSWWGILATALLGLSAVAHLAYYGMGEARFDYRYWHMYALQALYLTAVVVILFGGYDVWQRLASLLDRLRRVLAHSTGLVWASRAADRTP
jgi:hypothetical protein